MTIDDRTLRVYRSYLLEQERERSTIEKYGCCVTAFVNWLDGRPLTKEEAVAWKEELKSRCANATVNASLAALNGFFRFLGRDDCRLKFLKVQRRVFRDQSRELTQQEFKRLVEAAAANGKTRLALLLETIGGTGIRVGEVRYITVEAAQTGKDDRDISLMALLRFLRTVFGVVWIIMPGPLV